MDKMQIRNSTVDFLVFTKDTHEEGIEVRVQNQDVWLTQKAISQLFDVDRSVVTKHLKNTVCANFAQTADDGKTYQYRIIQDRLYQSDFDRLIENSNIINGGSQS